jgi:tRNA-splicing ligase RtcB
MTLTVKTDKPYRIFAEYVEQTALDQFELAMNQDCVVRGSLMPDVHTGYALPIGAVVATRDIIFPSWVGYDIGCGMLALETSFDPQLVRRHARDIFDAIYRDVPVGFNSNNYIVPNVELDSMPVSDALSAILATNRNQLGSMGGNNHFIEIGTANESTTWIIIHSGSRGVGKKTADHYMRIASGDGKAREGNFGLDSSSVDGRAYIQDLDYCLKFALENRREMMRRVENRLSFTLTGGDRIGDVINRNHNHAELRDGLWIHRKGATHAENGMMGVVPGNMREGSFVIRGKGNPESLWSSSHGAGRVMGRKEASRTLDVSEFESTMVGVTAKVGAGTIEESPMAYKSIFSVMAQQSELVDVVCHVKPIINIKA